MTIYAQEIKGVQVDIKRAGQSCTWTKIPRTANDTQPWKGGTTPVPQNFPNTYILFLKGGLSNALQHLMKNTDVTDGAPDAIMAGGLSFTPELTDVVIRGTETLLISDIDILAPDGTPILYYLRFQ